LIDIFYTSAGSIAQFELEVHNIAVVLYCQDSTANRLYQL